jgi:hypothetical protein
MPYFNPPTSISEKEIVGTWEVHYWWGEELIDIRENGTYIQKYYDTNPNGYVFQTNIEPWWMERFEDGRVRIHFVNARFFVAGVEESEKLGTYSLPFCIPQALCIDGKMIFPTSFFDPVADEIVHMQGELVLNLRADNFGNIYLTHMWRSSEGGYAIIGGEMEIYQRKN